MKFDFSKEKYSITILGGGSFGTALADISAANNCNVNIWMRSKEQVDYINKNSINHKYAPNLKLHKNISASSNLVEALQFSDIVLVAIPSHSFRSVISQAKPNLKNKIIISTTKGIENKNFSLMSQILHEEIPDNIIGVLSGPNLAKEILQKKITASVFASKNDELCSLFQRIWHCNYFRIYSSHDTYGVELAGALKNIYAIMTGIGTAIGIGENTRSFLITRSLAEMSRFAVKLGANPLTFLGLAGVGDLIATCSSNLSRNFRVGYELGKNKKIKEILKSLNQEAEGINTLQQVYKKSNELGIYMPLSSALYDIIFKEKNILDLIKTMMLNEPKTDIEFTMK